MPHVVWRLAAGDATIASVRYRCLTPVRHLEARGVVSTLSWGRHTPPPAQTAVFVKSFRGEDIALAAAWREEGTLIVLDLCDDVFHPAYPESAARGFLKMLAHADGVTTTNRYLAERIRQHTSVPVAVIPDPVEWPPDVEDGARRLRRARWSVWRNDPRTAALDLCARMVRARAFTRPAPTAADSHPATVVWFGNSGGAQPRYGLLNVVDIGEQLAAAADAAPFELLVVTDDEAAYRRTVAMLPLTSRFVRWDVSNVGDVVARSNVAIVPNAGDSFGLSKSSNRAVHALSRGTPVVASRTPAMEELDGALLLDDFARGIPRYLQEPVLVAQHLSTARDLLAERFSGPAVAWEWMTVFERFAAGRRRAVDRVPHTASY